MSNTLVQSAVGSVGSTNASSVTVTTAATGANNLLVAWVFIQGANGAVITPPGGWSQVGTTLAINGGTGTVAMYARLASTSGVTSHTFTFDAAYNAAVAFEEWNAPSGFAALDAWVGQQNAKSTTVTTGTTSALSGSGELAIWGMAVQAGSVLTSSSVLSGYTQDTNAAAASSESTHALAYLYYNANVGPAATSSGCTNSGAGGAGNTTLLAVFQPASGVALTATFAGAGTLSATLSAKTALSVTLPGVGTLSATLSTSTPGVSLAATLPGVGTLSATLAVGSLGAFLSVAQNQIEASARVGDALPLLYNDLLSNTGGASAAWSAVIAYAAGQPTGWLALSPTAGNLASGASLPLVISLTVGLLPIGSYQASITLSATGTSVVIGVSLTVLAAGRYTAFVNQQPLFVEATTLQGQCSIGQRSTAGFYAHTDVNTFLDHYQQVQIYDQNGALAFSGYLDPPKRLRNGRQPSWEYQLTFFDQHWLADKRIVGAVYTNMTPAQIATALFNTYLAPEGCTLGQIYDPNNPPVVSTSTFVSASLKVDASSNTIPTTIFAYCKVSEALDALVQVASAAGIPYYWQIDQNKAFWFVPYTAVVNTTVLDKSIVDNGKQSGQKPYVIPGNPLYRNAQYGTGFTAQTALQYQSGVGDGTGNMTMDYQLYQLQSATVNGAVKTFGIKGVDSGKDFYWAVGDAVIAQDQSAVKLGPNDAWEFTYIGQYPGVSYVQNNAAIAAQAAKDGTTGIVETVDNDQSIASLAASFQKESALLTRYSAPGLLFYGTTQTPGFAQGQLVTVNMPDYGLANVQMLIETVAFSDAQDGVNIWYAITAVSGPYDSTWPQFFQKLLTNPAPLDALSVGTSQNITLLQNFEASLAPSANLNVTVAACPIVGAATLCGTSTIVC